MSTPLVQEVRPRNITTCHPGVQGSVGDVLVKPRLRQSTPSMPIKFDPYFEGTKANKLGSNVQDGDSVSYTSKGGGARTRDSRWGGRRSFKTEYGWEHHDVQSPDVRTEPWVSKLGDYSWRRKVATVREAKRTGNMFLPLPGGYQPEPGDLARGGSVPRVTNIMGGDPLPEGGHGVVINQNDYYPTPVLTSGTPYKKMSIGLGNQNTR